MARRRVRWIEDVERVDLAIYAAVAGTPTPALDGAMTRLSRAADYSRLSLTAAAALILTGGQPGRRGSESRARFARGHGGRRQRRCQAARTPAAPRPTRARSPGRTPRADVDLALVPFRTLGRRSCVRHRRRPRVAGGRRSVAGSRRARRLLARPHRRALPGRCADGRDGRHHTGAAHYPRVRPCGSQARKTTHTDQSGRPGIDSSAPMLAPTSNAPFQRRAETVTIAATSSILHRARHAVIAPMA